KDRGACERVSVVEFLSKVRLLPEGTAQKDTPEDRAQARRPPLVQVRNRPVDFLPPTLALRKLRQELKREPVRFDQSHSSLPCLHCPLRLRGKWSGSPGGRLAWPVPLPGARPGTRAVGPPRDSAPSPVQSRSSAS